MTDQSDTIHDSVKEYYADRARSGTSCCGSRKADLLYPEDLTTGLPAEVQNFSLGCGNPFEEANMQPGETVLDLGSGGGLDCFLAAKQVGESGHVIGVDMTPEMLTRARASAARLDFKNIEFREGYLENLPVENGSVDLIISNCVINLSPDKPKVFKEMYRALKPGGRVAVSDTVSNGPLSEAMKNDIEAWGACVAGALDVSEYATGLVEAGFREVRVQPKDDNGQGVAAKPKAMVFSAIITARK